MTEQINKAFCLLKRIPYIIRYNNKEYYFVGMDANLILEIGGINIGMLIKVKEDKEFYLLSEDDVVLWLPKEDRGYIYIAKK